MTIEHQNIPSNRVHEPKDVDSATSGQVYVADGTNSGSWSNLQDVSTSGMSAGQQVVSDGSGGSTEIREQGWGYFADSRDTAGSPVQTLTSGARTKFICNGSGQTTQKNPSDLTNPLWSVANNEHIPVAEFDTYTIRLTMIIENYAGATPYIETELDIGGVVNVVWAQTIPLLKSGAAEKVSVVIPVFTGATYLANGGEVYLTYNGSGTADVYANSVFITRDSKNYV